MSRPVTRMAPICLALWLAMAAGALAMDGVHVNVAELGNGIYSVRGSFTVQAPAPTVWRVLTDYDQLGSFVPSVKSSIVKKPAPNTIVVAQESTTQFLAISKTMRVLLQLQEEPHERIDFADIGLQDFEHFAGSWMLQPADDGIRVDYMANAKPRIYLPFWGGSIMHDMVKGQLTHLKKEMLRRPTASADHSKSDRRAS